MLWALLLASFGPDLAVPESISRYLSLYLMMSIGFKGGVALITSPSLTVELIYLLMAALMVSFFQPILAYGLLRMTTRLDSPTAAAVAAHYGSISIITFATATAFLKANDTPYAGYMVAILALMEAPAIVSGLFIAHRAAPETNLHHEEEKKLRREIFTNGAIFLLFGAFLIGCVTGQPGLTQVEGFFTVPFTGILCLFLLDMGLVVAKQFHELKRLSFTMSKNIFSFPLILFGFYMPLLGASIGLIIAYTLALNGGTATLFMVLCASASYIAVPAAMRLALPEAKAAIYLPLSLAITFPFNAILGIPLYYVTARFFLN